MTVLILRGREYHRLMASLPTPARALTLSAINADYPAHLAELRGGGSIIVLSDDEQALLGVLTRDPAVFGDAQLAQQIEDGHLPPLEDLLTMSDRGEGP